MGSAHDRRIFDRAFQRFIANFIAREVAQPHTTMAWLLDHPRLWGVLGLVALAVSFSPRASVMATWACLLMAWMIWTAMMFGIRVHDRYLRITCVSMLSLLFAVFAYGLGSWLVSNKHSRDHPALVESEDDRLNERYLKASSQLGDPSETARIGAVYTLERIATDSPKHARQVVDLLINALKKETPQKRPDQISTPQEHSLSLETQVVLDVLGRRPANVRSYRIDMGYLDLHGANLNEGHFDMAFLAGSNLSGAFMNRAYFRGAVLTASDLSFAQMMEAHMEGADLKSCKLYGAMADRAVFSGAKLIGVLLISAELRNAKFDGAVLCADLRGAILSGANLRNADLSVVVKWNIDPHDGTRSMNASGRTEMNYADLTGADLTGANVSGVNLIGVRGLTRAQISKAIIDHGTTLPVAIR